MMFPTGLLMSRPIPIAAATGSSTKNTSLAACFSPESLTALLSTSVTPEGTHMTILGLVSLFKFTFLIKPWSISSTAVKSAITPSLSGLIVSIPSWVLPSISFASSPTARTAPVFVERAIIDGSLIIIPLPDNQINVLAVPRSIAMSPLTQLKLSEIEFFIDPKKLIEYNLWNI